MGTCNECMKDWETVLHEEEEIFLPEDWGEDEYGFVSFDTLRKVARESRREGLVKRAQLIRAGLAPEPCCRCPFVK